MKKKVSSIDWIGIVDIGKMVLDWPHNVHDGYLAKRKVVYEDGLMSDIVLDIGKSALGKPSYTATVISNKTIEKRVSSNNPTTAYREILKFLEYQVKGKLNGGRFFGLTTKDFELAAKSERNMETDEVHDMDRELETGGLKVIDFDNDLDDAEVELLQNDDEHLVSTHQRGNLSWVCVKNFGSEESNNPSYHKNLGRLTFKFRRGFESIRKWKTVDKKEINLHMKIEDQDGVPLFRVFTLENPLIMCSSKKLSEVKNMVFENLKISGKVRNWTGFSLFGLDRPEIIELCTERDVNTDYDSSESDDEMGSDAKMIKKQITDTVAKSVLDIRHRNAGETSGLKSKKAQNSRNQAIHEIVEHVSFGDISSIFLFFH